MSECANIKKNQIDCTCTYVSCERHGVCCKCVAHHRSKDQLPGCFFPADVEKTYDRSVRCFVQAVQARA